MTETELNATMLLTNMLEVSQVVSTDIGNADFNIYHIEVGPIGFSISARVIHGHWEIRTWSTYNV